MTERLPYGKIITTLRRLPQATASIRGSKVYSAIRGWAYFYQMDHGVLVAVHATGLPEGFLGLHIHAGALCSGTPQDPFGKAGMHFNPGLMPHPDHAGDLPPLLSNHGFAMQVFYTDRFSVRQILNKTLVLHAGPDDFTSQPAGNPGPKIACGEILPVMRGR